MLTNDMGTPTGGFNSDDVQALSSGSSSSIQDFWSVIWKHLTGNYGPGAANGDIAASLNEGVIGEPFEDAPILNSSPLIKDSEGDVISKWAKDHGYNLSKDTLDYLYNQFFTEKNNATAWERTLEADNTKYQRAVQDLKKAGLNPFLALSGSVNNAGNAQAGSVGSGSIASALNSKRQTKSNIASSLGTIIAVLGIAMIKALI